MARHDRILLGAALGALGFLLVGTMLAGDDLVGNVLVSALLLAVMGYDAWAARRPEREAERHRSDHDDARGRH